MENIDGEKFWRKISRGWVNVSCSLCLPSLSHLDNQEKSFTVCKFIKENVHINEKYEDIFESNVVESNVEPQLIRKISTISRLRAENV